MHPLASYLSVDFKLEIVVKKTHCVVQIFEHLKLKFKNVQMLKGVSIYT